MNDLAMGDEAGLERTEGGLVVPAGMSPIKHRTLTNDDWKLLRRAVVKAQARGIGTRFTCLECEQPMIPLDNEKAFKCRCSKWKLPGWMESSVTS